MGRLKTARDNHITRWVLPTASRLLIEAACKDAPVRPLDEVAHIEMGQSPTGESCNQDGDGVLLIGGPADLGLKYPDATRWTNQPTKVCSEGDIIICVRATIGEPRWADGNYCLGRGVAGLRPLESDLDSRFLFRIIEGNEDWLRTQGTGTTFKTISKVHLAQIKVPIIPKHEQEQISSFLKWLEDNSGNRPDFNAAPPLPPRLPEQRRIVAKIEALAAKIEEARRAKRDIEKKAKEMMLSAFANIVKDAPLKKIGNVAPLIRRSAEIQKDREYPELGIRSFGKGTFHKAALDYLSVGTKRLFRIEPGDLLLSNVFAWEGAIAVTQKDDEGRYGSHRFITCVPRKGIVTSEFLCFYLLSREGLQKIGEASPGGAGRNRTLGLKKLAEIEVPIPIFEEQLWFNHLQSKVDAFLTLQTQTAAELDALLPAILDRAFKGEL